MTKRTEASPRSVTPALLRRIPLPRPDEQGDKEGRGRVMVVGGAPELPGAVVLAGVGVLRAGAGKLRIGTCRSVALAVGIAIPEARVVGLPETPAGGIDPDAAPHVIESAKSARALLVGVGMMDPEAVEALLRRLIPELRDRTLVLDAGALPYLRDAPDALHHLGDRAILTPHAGEMASMLGIDKAEVQADPIAAAGEAAERFRAVVAFKGAETFVAAPGGELFRYSAGKVGLATSGSGDTLAGIVAGLAGRGAEPAHAAVWGAALHGGAGNVLAKRHGPIGFLARELLDEVPGVMARLS